ncbi:MAG TPA: hypothetical protein VEA35_07030 [Ramlibacter sp.]|nr:hypothetical protein [Ramlibacter sp.]
MAKDESSNNRDPDDRRRGSAGSARPYGAPGRRERRGRSGYGTESIRPHLRAQIEYQKLLRPTFPPEDPEEVRRSNEADD